MRTITTTLAILIGLGSISVLAQVPQQRPTNGTNVAVIDINFIFKNHQRFKASMDDIKKDIDAFEEHLRDQRNQITQQTEQLKGMPAGSNEYKMLEETIANVHTQLQLETGRKRKEILEREARVYYNAYKEVERQVEVFADRHGIDLVLRFSGEEMDPAKRDSVLAGVNRAIVFQRRLNITGDILTLLNRGTPTRQQQTSRPQVPGRGQVR